MKKILIILSFIISFTAYAQDDKTVTLVVSGQGKTIEEAKQNALRSAIEQAFGTFISSNTQILNDDLVKDEIVSVSNGNIKSFEIISEVNIPDVGFATSLKATVSVSKLTSFVESKGGEIEFKGSLFSFNIKQQILNEENELQIIKDLIIVTEELMSKSFDLDLKVGSPQENPGSSGKEWYIPFITSIKPNENFLKLFEYFLETLNGSTMSYEEAQDYVSLGKQVYWTEFGYFNSSGKTDYELAAIFYFRNEESHNYINTNFPLLLGTKLSSIEIYDDSDEYTIYPRLSDPNQRFFMIKKNQEQYTDFKSNFLPIYLSYGPNRSEKIRTNIFDVLSYLSSKNKNIDGFNAKSGAIPLMQKMINGQYEYYIENKFSLTIFTEPTTETEIAEITILKKFTLDEISKLSNFKVRYPI